MPDVIFTSVLTNISPSNFTFGPKPPYRIKPNIQSDITGRNTCVIWPKFLHQGFFSPNKIIDFSTTLEFQKKAEKKSSHFLIFLVMMQCCVL